MIDDLQKLAAKAEKADSISRMYCTIWVLAICVGLVPIYYKTTAVVLYACASTVVVSTSLAIVFTIKSTIYRKNLELLYKEISDSLSK